ncbi:PP2C family protein-serine/threonine phosphatase [Aeromicrobium stalagmiti]|uniref:PP2C family protein-serine/threonine phosphatase n=1 Tax=Aeromicrobium stalagmiti TaxID=2738988 RepID=UPI00156A190D|nr:SpoIIE family protein phosphatase [Aeromicrobium stalagmiti]NRQ49156.1 SpoIIE family protein phosphatase [Aeromicrobium stalagmiti]
MDVTHEDFFDEAPCGCVELDADGVVIAANRRFLALVDRSSADVVGSSSFATLVAAADRSRLEALLRQDEQAGGETTGTAVSLVRPDGSLVRVLLSASCRTVGGAVTTRVVVLPSGSEQAPAEEHTASLVKALQRTFVPAMVTDVPGLEVAGAHRPAGDGTEIGGDFYDVFQIRSGEWVVVVGDVSGKGVEAAVLTTYVRHAVRALAVQNDSPAGVLRALNTLLLAHGSERFCTVAILRLLKEDDHWLATVSSGGHPLPLLVASEGAVAEVGTPGSLIGMLSTVQLDDGRTTIGPGDRVVLYTDGVTEARRDSEPFGIDRLMSLTSGDALSADETTAAVLDRVLEFQDGQARDDIAIVTVRVLEPAEAEAGGAGQAPTAPLDAEARNRALIALQQAESDAE